LKVSALHRFKAAQNSPHAGFQAALDEIRSGAKTGHWIWYVFPQLAGLGTSSLSQRFAIDGEEEAMEFLRDSELRSRLLIIASAVADQIRTRRAPSLLALMGSEVDVRKLVSSLTLFRHIARTLDDAEPLSEYRSLGGVADEVLAVAASEGYPACAYTLGRLRTGK
jgi:uncharacterized protein (DUF1810 family)